MQKETRLTKIVFLQHKVEEHALISRQLQLLKSRPFVIGIRIKLWIKGTKYRVLSRPTHVWVISF